MSLQILELGVGGNDPHIMTERCNTIDGKLDEHIQEHKQDYKENMLCVQEIKTNIALLSQKFDDYLIDAKEYRTARQKSDEEWRKEMSPVLDAWKAAKWVFGGILAIGAFIGAIFEIRKFL